MNMAGISNVLSHLLPWLSRHRFRKHAIKIAKGLDSTTDNIPQTPPAKTWGIHRNSIA